MKRYRIPTEDVKLSDAEALVTQTRTFQRLFLIKQLGLAYLVYPAATHNRGAHSIRVLQEAQRILDALTNADYQTTEEEQRAVRMAALLHDIGHIPFGHTLEDEHTILPKHDRGTRLNEALGRLRDQLSPGPHHAEASSLIEAASPILRGISEPTTDPDWRADLVGNTICADLLAYIQDDPQWTGIEKRGGYYRIYDYFVREGDRLGIRLSKGGLRPDIVSAILDILDMRYALTERVVYHHAKAVASGMLARAGLLIGLDDDSELLDLGDEGFFNYILRRADEAEEPGARHIVESLQARRLYKRVFKIGRLGRENWEQGEGHGSFCEQWRSISNVQELLMNVEDDLRLPRGVLALWCPPQDAGSKLAKAQVVWDSAHGLVGPHELRSRDVEHQFKGVHDRVKTIEDQYWDLWSFWIALDPSHLDRTAAVIELLEDRIGISCDAVFLETHVAEIEGFRPQRETRRASESLLRDIQADAEGIMASARSGDAAPDETTLLEAYMTAVERRRASTESTGKSPPSPSGEGELFPNETNDAEPAEGSATDSE